MGYVLLGHGGLDVESGTMPADMEWVAIPSGTTLQFYSDTGQTLAYASKQLDLFESMTQPWDALDSTKVTYNLTLHSAKELWPEELKNNPGFAGHTLIRAGVDEPDPIRLCTGTRATCPTDPRQVASGATHTCSGILGKYAGEIHWLACTVVSGDQTAVTAARGDAPPDALLGTDPDSIVAQALTYAADYPAYFPDWFDKRTDQEKELMLKDPGLYAWDQGRKGDAAAAGAGAWVPTEADLANVSEGNKSYVKEGAEDFEHTWEIGGALVLLGNEHDPSFHSWVQSCPDYQTGTFEIKRATFGAGKIVFTGVSGPLQGTVESMVEGFSDKKVVFE
jgi:hypothetical protein